MSIVDDARNSIEENRTASMVAGIALMAIGAFLILGVVSVPSFSVMPNFAAFDGSQPSASVSVDKTSGEFGGLFKTVGTGAEAVEYEMEFTNTADIEQLYCIVVRVFAQPGAQGEIRGNIEGAGATDRAEAGFGETVRACDNDTMQPGQTKTNKITAELYNTGDGDQYTIGFWVEDESGNIVSNEVQKSIKTSAGSGDVSISVLGGVFAAFSGALLFFVAA